MKLRRVVAVVIGAVGISLGVVLPAQAAVSSNISDPFNGQHVDQNTPHNITGACFQNGAGAVVQTCTLTVINVDTSMNALLHNFPGGQNTVPVDESLPTDTAGHFRVTLQTLGTGGGFDSTSVDYYVDAVAPPAPADPPTVSITAPSAGTTILPNAALSLASTCSAGARGTIATCEADVAYPGGGHLTISGYGGGLPTNLSGDYIVTVKAVQTDGQTKSASTSYRVKAGAPSGSINGPTPGTAVNPGASLNLSSTCSAGAGATLTGCNAAITYPDGSVTNQNGSSSSLPTTVPGDYSITVTVTQDDGQTKTYTTWYRVNTPVKAQINNPVQGGVVNQGDSSPYNGGCIKGTGDITKCELSFIDPNGNPATQPAPNKIPTDVRGTYTVKLHAEDSNGLTDDAQVTYRVNAYPTVTITSPLDGLRVYTDTPVPAAYSCDDAEGPVATCAAPVAVGSPIDTSPAGPKSFNVKATDSDGATAEKTVAYNVYDKPTAHINGPAVNTVVNPGGAAPTFLGNCAGGVPVVTCTMTLTAPNGTTSTIASGATLPITQFGSYKLTVHVIDDFGTQQTATRYYKVNEAPHVTIVTPEAGTPSYFQGQDVTPTYSCFDDDNDGAITSDTIASCTGPAGPLATQDQPVGVYTYSVKAIDNDGAATTQTVSYKVVPVVGPCQGTGLQLLNNVFGQSGPADPCKTADGVAVKATAPLGAAAPSLLLNTGVSANVIEGHTVRTKPATFFARADVADATINILGTVNLKVTGVHSTATSKLLSCSTAQVTGTSTVGTLVLNGVPVVVGNAPLTIPLVVGALYLNQKVTTASGITMRAVFLDLPGTALDVVIGESSVAPRCGTVS
ncbi:MAG: hypothetical protein JWQ74_2941 [Marmoricola sp.]|nr:hypothetical protein [Marmoricola sp.]